MKRIIYQQLLEWKEKRQGEVANITAPTVLHAADYKEEKGIVYLPIYMASLL